MVIMTTAKVNNGGAIPPLPSMFSVRVVELINTPKENFSSYLSREFWSVRTSHTRKYSTVFSRNIHCCEVLCDIFPLHSLIYPQEDTI
jgi:hypothetical protein